MCFSASCTLSRLGHALRFALLIFWLCLHSFFLSGLTHCFVCSENLKYCPGSVKAFNFRHYNLPVPGADAGAPAILNENWALYLRVRQENARSKKELFARLIRPCSCYVSHQNEKGCLGISFFAYAGVLFGGSSDCFCGERGLAGLHSLQSRI